MPAVNFLALPISDRRAIINAAGQQLGRSPQVIEKDIWVCWTLATLKEVPGVPPFAFKGGTSLSKVYDAIARFSEDVDVTLDRTVFAPTLDPFADISNTQVKKISLALDEWLNEFSINTIKPHFDQAMIDTLGTEAKVCVLGEQRPGQLYVRYASVIDRVGEYVEDQVFLELGAKNKITPNAVHVINTYCASSSIKNVAFPEAEVPVLAAERTFWEKATLIHAEIHRPSVRGSLNRWSRHWSDLARMADASIGQRAVADIELLEDVVTQKSVLYKSGHANYDKCLSGKLRLVPDEALHSALKTDYEQMCDASMFWSEPDTFVVMMEQLERLELHINVAVNAV